MTHLVLKDISASYGEQPILQQLSFSLEKGDIGCLLGPSGCGKTTVLRCIAGFEQISSGSIELNHRILSNQQQQLPPEQRKIGMVFQDYALFPHLSIAENIAFGLKSRRSAEAKIRVDELLATVGLLDERDKYPHQISGGQQQRVALARALAPAPSLLLLDEPFSNLDVDLRERLSHEVRDILKASGTTAILVTHDQNEAFAVADVIGIMHHGCIQQWDSPHGLYHRPVNRFVAGFVGQGVLLRGKANSRGIIDTELGELNSAASNTIEYSSPTQQYVEVLLRPVDVIIDNASSTRATVVRKVFRGADILYTLQLASGAQLLTLTPSHDDHPQGTQVGIRPRVAQVVAFNVQDKILPPVELTPADTPSLVMAS